jgi:hypothetical protein
MTVCLALKWSVTAFPPNFPPANFSRPFFPANIFPPTGKTVIIVV